MDWIFLLDWRQTPFSLVSKSMFPFDMGHCLMAFLISSSTSPPPSSSSVSGYSILSNLLSSQASPPSSFCLPIITPRWLSSLLHNFFHTIYAYISWYIFFYLPFMRCSRVLDCFPCSSHVHRISGLLFFLILVPILVVLWLFHLLFCFPL